MAKIVDRPRKDGGTSYAVKWVLGGGRATPGNTATETFTDRKRAELFKTAVELQGQQWPIGWVKGKGYVVQGEAVEQAPPTMDEVEAKWLEDERNKIAMRTKKPKTVGRDARAYELHISPTFGSMDFASITRAEVRAWLATQAKASSAKSVANRHGLLAQIFNYGIIELGLRIDNPCEGNRLPRAEVDKQLRFFTHAEFRVLRSCMRSDVHLLVQTLLESALRWGEISALRVGDITVSTSGTKTLSLYVQRGWSLRDEDYDEDPIRPEVGETRRYKLGAPKNGKARFVQVSGVLAHELAMHIAGKEQDDYVFTTAKGNPWRYEDFHSDRWAPAIKLAAEHGLTKHGTVHMLRHSAVVWMLADGVTLPEISSMLGHASIQITHDLYGGMLNLKDERASQAMARQALLAERAVLARELPSITDVDARRVRDRNRAPLAS